MEMHAGFHRRLQSILILQAITAWSFRVSSAVDWWEEKVTLTKRHELQPPGCSTKHTLPGAQRRSFNAYLMHSMITRMKEYKMENWWWLFVIGPNVSIRQRPSEWWMHFLIFYGSFGVLGKGELGNADDMHKYEHSLCHWKVGFVCRENNLRHCFSSCSLLRAVLRILATGLALPLHL